MEIKRKKTKQINLGRLKIGGSSPISVQSMTKSKISNTAAIKGEIKDLINCGCEVIRIAVPDGDAVLCLGKLMDQGLFTDVPVIADIHFDYRLALDCIEAGVDGIRINPGNIGGAERTAKVVEAAKKNAVAIRIGINSGSIDKKILKKNKGILRDSMIESAMENIRIMENLGFYNFKISAKASSVLDTISVYRAISKKTDYPLHLGVTEAGPMFRGSIKSSVGLGVLLAEGIGDTIRVSLTERSVEEVRAGYLILSSLGLRAMGVDIISCPTCGRTRVDLPEMVREVEAMTEGIKDDLKLAVMGCIVNGPGEAKDADLGIAFGKDKAALFLNGSVIKRVEKNRVIDEFRKELKKLVKD
ncbi:MAG: flavodoxin-dependent (E)-4-hydroxy-3-methylbut-2-enyl-diphosphate synthase [Actinomycetota bacterium]|nr:MAG: flavodoxin-dependent (E)-4-hydroxy-3-methylbut-2-enyl-diphosphate synthase [Actinomycetota bacterium]